MLLGTRHPRLRCVAVWGAVTVCCAAVVVITAGGVGLPSRADTFAAALVELCRGAVALCAGWLWLTTTMAVVEAWRGCPPPAPVGVRRWVLVACGVAVASGAVSGVPVATAAPGHHSPAATSLPYPDRAVDPSDHHRHARRAPPTGPSGPPVSSVVVQPGDSLWVIAARSLGPDATAADVTARWHALYAANRIVIGPDPDLIEPGLRLLVPRKDPS